MPTVNHGNKSATDTNAKDGTRKDTRTDTAVSRYESSADHHKPTLETQRSTGLGIAPEDSHCLKNDVEGDRNQSDRRAQGTRGRSSASATVSQLFVKIQAGFLTPYAVIVRKAQKSQQRQPTGKAEKEGVVD